MFKRDLTKRYVGSLFLAIFIGYISSITLFIHSHDVNGSTITHSHIHAESHHNTHDGGHSKSCLTLIDQMSHPDFLSLSIPDIDLSNYQFVDNSYLIKDSFKESFAYVGYASLRAPPVL